jgi:hypothetical protein
VEALSAPQSYIERPHRHRLSKHPIYSIWRGMVDRCRNPRCVSYPRYGGRGIRVCDRWMDFAAFLADMGERPSKGHSLDRIDNDGDYEPSNVRWATRAVQMANRHTTIWITYKGRTLPCCEWAKELNLPVTTLGERMQKGWTPEEAVETPLGAYRRPSLTKCVTFRGETRSVTEWAQVLGIPRVMLMQRITRGATWEEALSKPYRSNPNLGKRYKK